jgi:hypothetical protein
LYTDLTTAGPAVTVTIPASGNALVTVTVGLTNSSADVTTFMSFAVSDATTRVASDATSLECQPKANSIYRMSATYFVSGLTSGSNTFTAKYRVAAGTGTFVNRSVIVIPLP